MRAGYTKRLIYGVQKHNNIYVWLYSWQDCWIYIRMVLDMGCCHPRENKPGRRPYKLTDAQKLARSMQVKQQWALRIAKRQAAGLI